jgi:hypothetical protein
MSNATKTVSHTPGPWTFDAHPIGNNGISHAVYDESAAALPIAGVSRLLGAGEANARLIAAAPDLLEQTLKMTELLEKLYGEGEAAWYAPVIQEHCINARAAIARATGGKS